MKHFLVVGLAVSVIWICGGVAAQESPGKQQSIATAAVSQNTFTEQLRKTVGFLRVTYRDGLNRMQVTGTCFFVYVEDKRLGENRGFTYLVTNRHMAQPGIERGVIHPVDDVFIRMNLIAPRSGNESVEEKIPMGPHLRWFFPDDDSIDLAVLQADPDQTKYDFQMIPESLLATPNQIKSFLVEPGDSVVFAGYFYQFPGQKRIEPIVRQGILAMMPDEMLSTTLQKPGQLFLADAHAFHGNSGSPLFVKLGGSRHGQVIAGENYLLIGVISGYYPEGESFSVPAATVLTGEVHDNSGIATVVPAQELLKVLDSTELQADRDSKIAARITGR
jgi:hypothetical protein